MRRPLSLFLNRTCKLFSKVCPLMLIYLLLASCGSSDHNPPKSLAKTDLIGMWEASYDEWGKDRIDLRMDGFTQKYQESLGQGYVYEFAGDQWWLEYLPQGFVRVHLQGAKYFRVGVDFSNRSYLYDPFVNETVSIKDALILEVRVTQAKELRLHHLVTDPDSGHTSLFGNEANVFRRVSDK